MMQAVIFSLLLLLQATPMPRFLQVMLMDADNLPISDQSLQLEIQAPFMQLQCVTDADGQCEFKFASGEDIVRGRLIIMGRGVRPVIWRGDSLTLPLMLDENNAFSIPTDFVDLPDSAVSTQTISAETTTAITPLPPATQSALLVTQTATRIPPLVTVTSLSSSPTDGNPIANPTIAPDTPSQANELGGWEFFSLLIACAIGMFMLLLAYALWEGPQ